MRKNENILVVMLLMGVFNITLVAEDFYGRIIKDNINIPNATFILVQLDTIEISDEEGNFVFYGVEPGEYTLKIITTEEEEIDFSITINADQDTSNTPEIFKISTKDIDNVIKEEIIITAEKDIQQKPNIIDYSAEFIENVPLIDKDPFNIIINEAGVNIEQRNDGAILSDIVPDQLSRNFFDFGNGYSVYEGDNS